MRKAQHVSARTMEPFQAFATAAILYLLLTLLASRVPEKLEQRYKIKI
jgi:polar amino acid transport system permease protein